MTALHVPDRYFALAPLIVTAPTTRCGTTLVQRLISASDNAFVFGEDIAQHIKLMTGLFINLMQHYEKHGEAIDGDFARALAGTLTDWRPGLTPPTAIMLRAWMQTYYQIPSTVAEYALSIGRPVWGFKCPDFSRELIRGLLTLMPHAKVIYLFRDLRDALKSAKARRFVITDKDCAAFCAQWARNLDEALALADERILFVRYEDLITNRANQVRQLERFSGANGVDARAFNLKVNTFEGDEANGFSPTQYIRPASLTDADHAAIAAHAGAMMDRLYGDQHLDLGVA